MHTNDWFDNTVETKSDILPNYPRERVILDGVEREMIVVWKADPDEHVWRPCLERIGYILENFISQHRSILSEDLIHHIEMHSKACFSRWKRMYDARAKLNIIKRITEYSAYKNSSNEVKEAFNTYLEVLQDAVDVLKQVTDDLHKKRVKNILKYEF